MSRSHKPQFEKPLSQRQQVNRQALGISEAEFRRRGRAGKKIVAVGLAVAATIGGAKIINETGDTSPKARQASVTESTLIESALGERIINADNQKLSVSAVRLNLRPGVKLRSTPSMVKEDPINGIKSNVVTEVPAGMSSLDVDYPLSYVDENDHQYYGFALLSHTESEAPKDSAEATVWVNMTELKKQSENAIASGGGAYYAATALEPLDQSLELDFQSDGSYVAAPPRKHFIPVIPSPDDFTVSASATVQVATAYLN